VPVRHYPRVHGRSKYGLWNRIFVSLFDLVAVRWMMGRVLRYKITRRVMRDPSRASGSSDE